MFFQMLLTSVLQKQLGLRCNDTPSCHLGLCLWPAKGSANVLPVLPLRLTWKKYFQLIWLESRVQPLLMPLASFGEIQVSQVELSPVAPEPTQSSEWDCVLPFPLTHLLFCFRRILFLYVIKGDRSISQALKETLETLDCSCPRSSKILLKYSVHTVFSIGACQT